jgi:hypothetical protein
MANLDWDKPIACSDGSKASLYGTVSASGGCRFADGTQQHAEQYAEMHEIGVRRLVMREGETEYRAFDDNGIQVDIHLDALFGKPPRPILRIVQMELDMAGMDDSAMWGMF